MKKMSKSASIKCIKYYVPVGSNVTWLNNGWRNERRTSYDVRRYMELLTEACNSIIEPFGLKLTIPPLSSRTSMKFLPCHR